MSVSLVRNFLGPLIPPDLPPSMSSQPPDPSSCPPLAAWRRRMDRHRRQAAARWTRRRARASCYMPGRPPASAGSPSSTARTATMTCHPRPCPGTRRSPARREHPPPPAWLALPGLLAPAREGGGCPTPTPAHGPGQKLNSTFIPYRGLNPFIAYPPSEV